MQRWSQRPSPPSRKSRKGRGAIRRVGGGRVPDAAAPAARPGTSGGGSLATSYVARFKLPPVSGITGAGVWRLKRSVRVRSPKVRRRQALMLGSSTPVIFSRKRSTEVWSNLSLHT